MNASSKWKIATVILALCCVGLAYRVFDQGITRTYTDAGQETSSRHIKLLIGLIGHDWNGQPKEQVMKRLSAYVAAQPQGSIVLKPDPETGDILFEDVRFQFKDGKLVKVSS